MNDQTLSGIQATALAAVSAETAAEIEAESRAWMMQCPRCKAERSIWEAGGIRYKAAGNPRKMLRCASCSQTTWHRIYRPGAPDEGRAGSWVVRLALSIVALSLVGAGLIVVLVLWLTGVI